jgi:hypothetical protein
MGRSVNYLSNALRVNYFSLREEEWENIDYEFLVEDIVETFKSSFPEFDEPKGKWDNRETKIILQGYGLEVGLSGYIGLWSLSVRVWEDSFYFDDDEERNKAVEDAKKWVEKNWDEVSKHWNQYRKVGTFSNGEAVFEKVEK